MAKKPPRKPPIPEDQKRKLVRLVNLLRESNPVDAAIAKYAADAVDDFLSEAEGTAESLDAAFGVILGRGQPAKESRDRRIAIEIHKKRPSNGPKVSGEKISHEMPEIIGESISGRNLRRIHEEQWLVIWIYELEVKIAESEGYTGDKLKDHIKKMENDIVKNTRKINE